MGPKVEAVASGTEQPKATKVVVIGGGIIGVATALTLAERGVPVVLCEKGHIAGEQSSRNWGWCRQMGRDPREIPLIVKSLALWRGMNERIGAETGFRQSGILYFCSTETDMARRQAFADLANPQGVDSRLVSAREAAELVPGSAKTWAGALYTPSDGRAEPQLAAPAMARAAQAKGAVVLQNCAVRGIEWSAGRVSGVVTEKGPLACEAVVLAGGAWSSAFLRNLSLRLPQLTTRSTVCRTAPLPGGPDITAWGPGWAFRKRLDGGYTLAHGDFTVPDIVPDSFRFFFEFLPLLKAEWSSVRLRLSRYFWQEWRRRKHWRLDEITPFEVVRTLDPAPFDWVMDDMMKHLTAAYPIFKAAKIEQSWAGFIDTTPDVVPVISPVEGKAGLVIATGFSGHGFGIGPGAGQLAADLVMGAPPLVEPTAFRYSRFTDGSKPQPLTGL